MCESDVRVELASLINSRLARNANIIIRDIYGEGEESVYGAEECYSVATFIGRATNSNFKKTKIFDSTINSSNGRLGRNFVPPIVIELGATQSELKLLDIAYTCLNYEKEGGVLMQFYFAMLVGREDRRLKIREDQRQGD